MEASDRSQYYVDESPSTSPPLSPVLESSSSKNQSDAEMTSPERGRLSLSSPRSSGKKQRRSKSRGRKGSMSSKRSSKMAEKKMDKVAHIKFVLPGAVTEQLVAGNVEDLDFCQVKEFLRKFGRQEYKAILKSSRIPRTWAEKLQMFPSATTFLSYSKNRYRDVLADEPSRVKLVGLDHDYINANYILGPEVNGAKRVSYIACQAPLPSTMTDFWWMVWQERSCVVVMLTKFREKGAVKAHPYWPKDVNGVVEYGPFEILCVNQKQLNGICISTLRVTKAAGGDWDDGGTRDVYHLFYTEWPDFGVPKSSRTIRSLLSYANLYVELGSQQGTQGPIVCHCSAGIGRTGTFIGIHMGISLIEAHIMPDVWKLVKDMRNARNGMIQTDAQYLFVYEALNDHIHNHAEAKKPQRNTSVSSMVQKTPSGGRGRSFSVSNIDTGDLDEQSPEK